MNTDPAPWYLVRNGDEVPSPALLLYPERIEENLRRMIAIAGGVEPLRPHVKTHKTPEIVRMQIARGINKFKCATIAEAEMLAHSGGGDVLLAYQPVGPNIARLVELVRRFPRVRFAAIADDPDTLHALSKAFTQAKLSLDVLLDIDCGMHRTGIPSERADALYELVKKLPGLSAAGLHAYDGHLHESNPAVRAERCRQAMAPVLELRSRILKASGSNPRLVAGGTPTFATHAHCPDVECSPGTCVLWDAGYATNMPDLDFLCAALLLSRVVSKPGENRLCLDLGHKAVASENPPPRVQWLGLADAKAITHSEEHLVIETGQADRFAVGDCLYGVPWHICPTVALHSEGVVVQQGRAETRWKVIARERFLSV